jgi:TATA-box binding protein (TBP) (component of TFIID and TFIIIB)
MDNIEEQWKMFTSTNYDINSIDCSEEPDDVQTNIDIPKCTLLNISTKSKIIYLNSTFDLYDLFWKLKIIDYDTESDGIIKKQMKFNFIDKTQVSDFENKIKNEPFVNVKILNQINNPSGRVIFKDVRKVDIGISNKDIIKPKKKSKSAFYNCFVIIFRKYYEKRYREFHIKMFNSGKVEIPGIKSEDMINLGVDIIKKILQPHFDFTIEEIKEKRELVLVNSNFNCNYYLNREKLVTILKNKYKIKCNLDSCNYPGIQCKYKLENNVEVSFMIFRTGSVLIVGKCDDDQLNRIYLFLKNVFNDEYINIRENESKLEIIEKQKNLKKKKNKKILIINK